MTNDTLENSEELNTTNKRKRILAAVTQDLVTSEDDDNVADGMDICDIIENHSNQHRQTTTSNALHALGETIRNTLLEINEIREQNRERRHRELLEVLSKMAHYETCNRTDITLPKSINLNRENLTENNKQYSSEMDILKEQQFSLHANEVVLNDTTSQDTFNNSQETEIKSGIKQQTTAINDSPPANNSNINFNETLQPIKITCSFNKTPNKYIKILPNSTLSSSSNQSQLSKIKNVIKIKSSSNTKEELQKMRAQMLELQRQKMEDRERKKRELLQMQNV